MVKEIQLGNVACDSSGVISQEDVHQMLMLREEFVAFLIRKDEIPQSDVSGLCDRVEIFLNEKIKDYPGQEKIFGHRFFLEFIPYFVLSDSHSRVYYKNHGYAGDYEAIKTIYENKARGKNPLGIKLDRWSLDHSSAQAVRDRRKMVHNFLIEEVEKKGTLRAASLGCGPAVEVTDMATSIIDNSLKVDLIDIDQEALDFAKSILEEKGVSSNVNYIQKNVLLLANKGETTTEPYDVIYSLGLIDYFKDGMIIRLLNWMYDNLAEGGRVLLGNFKEGHKDENYMKYLCDWQLVNRSEERLISMAKESKFVDSEIKVIDEDEGIQLFLAISK